jgi:predicted glycosyltransferase
MNPVKKIWIDLDNSPHVPFFYPIICQLEKRDYDLLITIRDGFQVRELAHYYGLPFIPVGQHSGKNKVLKLSGLFYRAGQLMPYMSHFKPDLALSHGSRSQMIYAGTFRIPSVEFSDYEFARNIPFFPATWLMTPEAIPTEMLTYKKGFYKYPGIKEDVYVPDFKPDAKTTGDLYADRSKIFVLLRPPATEAHYHNPESERILDAVIDHVTAHADARIVLLPRNHAQRIAIQSKWDRLFKDKKIVVPPNVVNGLDLIWHSDLVISGGGTMNREAAALGVPVYSIFRGKIGAIDRYLAGQKRLVLIETAEEAYSKIFIRPRDKSRPLEKKSNGTLKVIIENLEKIARG